MRLSAMRTAADSATFGSQPAYVLPIQGSQTTYPCTGGQNRQFTLTRL
ncbi:hypothetical protein ACFPM7_21660 [Actinokineospora guangxiensis]|uniref:Uncharacterized protein n=1 Tax=Actinokineospora guangxiensis TaxID=1490288 RepID=A0ABW0EQH2_9PSEU